MPVRQRCAQSSHPGLMGSACSPPRRSSPGRACVPQAARGAATESSARVSPRSRVVQISPRAPVAATSPSCPRSPSRAASPPTSSPPGLGACQGRQDPLRKTTGRGRESCLGIARPPFRSRGRLSGRGSPQVAAAADAADSAGKSGHSRVVLTPGLATRLLADLLEAYRSNSEFQDAQSAVCTRWGFDSAAEMTSCIEAQANATYKCTSSPVVGGQKVGA
mmetsp:Transcript_69473/g.206984  ORF Transcript_69473/g.206984 Transcript_69473/m.206984 type:complete len:220 (-) Transcript_69473:60-719(-)